MSGYNNNDIIRVRRGHGTTNGYSISLPQCELTLNKELSFEYKDGRLLIREVEIDDIHNTRSVKDECPRRTIEFTLKGFENTIELGEYLIDLDESNEYEIVIYCTKEDLLTN